MFLARKQIHTRYPARYTVTRVPRARVNTWHQVTRGILEAMHLQLRLQSAGWSADVQRWESDEDSEDSEGECAEDEKEAGLSEAQILRLMA